MGKFEKAETQSSLGPGEAVRFYETFLPMEDPLEFLVRTLDGKYNPVGFTRYRDGDAANGIIGFPELIVHLLPEIKRTIGDFRPTNKAISSLLARRLPPLFRYLTDVYRSTGSFPKSANDFDDSDGQLLQEFLRKSPKNPRDNRKCYTSILTLLNAARDSDQPKLRWPSYAMADPELLDDVEKIAREVRAIRVAEAFKEVDKNGGQGADLLKRMKEDLLARSGKTELETDDIGEAAEILGKAEVVRPGMLCTAQPLERGACSTNLGLRDFGLCTPTCLHHLETAALRQDREKKVDYLLEKIAPADEGVRVFYQGQLLANFVAFPDLIVQYESDARLASALRDADQIDWISLPIESQARLKAVLERER